MHFFLDSRSRMTEYANSNERADRNGAPHGMVQEDPSRLALLGHPKADRVASRDAYPRRFAGGVTSMGQP